MTERVPVRVREGISLKVASNEESQESCSTGYRLSCETVGTDVTVKAEFLDTYKEGVVAYLWQ